MNTVWLTVKIAPGSDISDACADAVRLAQHLQIDIWFDFNGVKVLARPTDRAAEVVEAWRISMESTSPHKVAAT